MVNNKDNRVFMSLNYRSNSWPLEIWCFKNIKFLRGNYQPIVPRQKHSGYCLNRNRVYVFSFLNIVPEEAHHCVHQHWAMGSLLFPFPVRHQGQFQGAGHKAWITDHLADASKQTLSELCIWDLFSSELHGQIQVQLAVVQKRKFQN